MRRILTLAALLAAPAVVPTATAFAEDPLPLKPGPNVEMVQGYCNSCHTSNYIIMNSTFLSTAAWKAEVQEDEPGDRKLPAIPIRPFASEVVGQAGAIRDHLQRLAEPHFFQRPSNAWSMTIILHHQ